MSDSGERGDLSAIARAVAEDNIETVRALIREGHVVGWEPFPFDQSALHIAADHGDSEMIEVLLAAGGTVHIDSLGYGWTPLGLAVRKGHYEAVRILLANGADVGMRDVSALADSPLSDAVQGRFLKIVEALLEAGADPQTPGWMNMTPIDHAKRQAAASSDVNDARVLQALVANRKRR